MMDLLDLRNQAARQRAAEEENRRRERGDDDRGVSVSGTAASVDRGEYVTDLFGIPRR